MTSLASDAAIQLIVLDNLYRGSRGTIASARGTVEFIEGDIRNRDRLRRAMEGVSIVIHLAAQSNVIGAVRDLDHSFSVNVQGTLEVLQAAREAGVRRFVFTSSREVYGEPAHLPVPETAPLRAKNAYGASKIAGETYCRVFDDDVMSVAVLRLANVYGPNDRDRVIPIFLENASRLEPLTVYGGEQILDFIWIDKVVDAIRKAAFGERLPGPVNIGSGVGTEITTLARRIAEMAPCVPIRTLPARSFETVRYVADIQLARRILDFHPPADPLHALPQLARGFIGHSMAATVAHE